MTLANAVDPQHLTPEMVVNDSVTKCATWAALLVSLKESVRKVGKPPYDGPTSFVLSLAHIPCAPLAADTTIFTCFPLQIVGALFVMVILGSVPAYVVSKSDGVRPEE